MESKEKMHHTELEKIETTSRGRHALTAMIDLTSMQQGKPVPLSEIAAKRKISLSYLEQMFAGLRKHDLVHSHRGPGGGYCLGRPANEISVASILRAAEDTPTAERIRKASRRASDIHNQSDLMWEKLGQMVYGLLERISLEDVLAENLEIYEKVFKTEA